MPFNLVIIILSLLSLTVDIRQEKTDPHLLEEWVRYLSSDEMKGRQNGSPEMALAARWLAGKFEDSGLRPLYSDKGFIQNYTFTSGGKKFSERNVIGFIEGADPILKNEFILITAHFDHIGIRSGNPEDSICNGADDNASGTATILGIAKNINDTGSKPSRSVIFAAFSGEEYGTKGSRYFLNHNPVKVKQFFLNLNFEMTGHSESLGKRTYYMTGCPYSNIDDLIEEFNETSGFKLVDTLSVAQLLFNSSDNISFSRISVKNGITYGVPSGTIATSTIPDYLHTPSDEAELIDFDNMSDLVNHFSDLVLWFSNIRKDVKWTDPSFVRP